MGAGALGNIITSIVTNSHFVKWLVARLLIIFGSHVASHVSEHVDSYQLFFPKSAARRFPGPVFFFDYCHMDEKSDFVRTTYGGSIPMYTGTQRAPPLVVSIGAQT